MTALAMTLTPTRSLATAREIAVIPSRSSATTCAAAAHRGGAGADRRWANSIGDLLVRLALFIRLGFS